MSDLIDALRTASRCLLEDGFVIEVEEAVRVGMALSEMAGVLLSAEHLLEPKDNPDR